MVSPQHCLKPCCFNACAAALRVDPVVVTSSIMIAIGEGTVFAAIVKARAKFSVRSSCGSFVCGLVARRRIKMSAMGMAVSTAMAVVISRHWLKPRWRRRLGCRGIGISTACFRSCSSGAIANSWPSVWRDSTGATWRIPLNLRQCMPRLAHCARYEAPWTAPSRLKSGRHAAQMRPACSSLPQPRHFFTGGLSAISIWHDWHSQVPAIRHLMHRCGAMVLVSWRKKVLITGYWLLITYFCADRYFSTAFAGYHSLSRTYFFINNRAGDGVFQ